MERRLATGTDLDRAGACKGQSTVADCGRIGDPTLSVVVPVLDEAGRIQSFLRHLRRHLPRAQIIVVDGGSRDLTVEKARGDCDHLVVTETGRARQMNAGAAIADGTYLWFLHCDTEIAPDANQQLFRLLTRPAYAGGCFRMRIPREAWIYRLSDALGNLAVDLTHVCYGDHGIFCRRESFQQVRGYPELPILEDAEFCRRLIKVGKFRQLPGSILASSRRYDQVGPLRLTTAFLVLSLLWWFRVPNRCLHRIYCWAIRRRD